MTAIPPSKPPPLPPSFQQSNRNVFTLLGDKYEEIISRLDGLRILAEERERVDQARRSRVEQIAQLDLAMSKTVHETRHDLIQLSNAVKETQGDVLTVKRREKLRWWFLVLLALAAALGAAVGRALAS